MRPLLRCTLWVIWIALGAALPGAAFGAPRIVVSGKAAACSPAPVVVGGELYVPLSFRYGGLPVSADTDAEAVIIRGPAGSRARVPFLLRDDRMYYPIARACAEVGLRAQWVPRIEKLFVAPKVQPSRPEVKDGMATLRIASNYPVTFRVSALADPARILVEVPDAHLHTESATLPVGEAGISQVRAAQYSYDPPVVRIVIDVQGAAKYRAVGAGSAAGLSVRVVVPSALAPDVRVAAERLLNAPVDAPAATIAHTLPLQPPAGPDMQISVVPGPGGRPPTVSVTPGAIPPVQTPPSKPPVQTPPTVVPAPPAPVPPGQVMPPLFPPMPLIDLTSIGVETDAESTRVVMRGTGALRGRVERLSSPPRLAIDIPDAAARAEVPAVAPGTPLVQGIRVGQYTERVSRVVIDLAGEVEFTLSQGPDPGTLVLNLRAAFGLQPTRGLQGFRVMLDPGHGGSLSGTKGLAGGREQDLNLDVAKRVYELLERAGARPTMTRFGDNTVSLHARPSMANAQRVQVFISIHANANGRVNSARGIETYYCWPHSLSLANALHRQLVVELGAPDRKVRKRPGLVVTRETKMPSVLLEIGYMNHREEDRLLGTSEYRQRVAKAIFNGIARYAGGAVLESADEEPMEGVEEGPDGTLDLSHVEQEQ